MKVAILISFLTLALSSCADDVANPAVVLSQILDNQSVYDLEVITEIDGVSGIDTIPSMSLDTLFMFATFGRLGEFSDCALAPINPIAINVLESDTLELSIDPNNSENWDFTILQSNDDGGGQAECRLTIEDSDIN